MRKLNVSLLALAAAAGGASQASAQIPMPNLTPFAVEVRGGLAVPTGQWKDDLGLKADYALGANVSVQAMPLVAVYGAYNYNRFKSDAFSTGGTDVSVIDRGFSAGVKVGVPTPFIPIDPWVKAGAVFHNLKAKVSDGSGSAQDDFANGKVGFEVGAGVGIALGPKVSFTPGVSYTRYGLKDTASGSGTDDKAEYITADVGLRIRI